MVSVPSSTRFSSYLNVRRFVDLDKIALKPLNLGSCALASSLSVFIGVVGCLGRYGDNDISGGRRGWLQETTAHLIQASLLGILLNCLHMFSIEQIRTLMEPEAYGIQGLTRNVARTEVRNTCVCNSNTYETDCPTVSAIVHLLHLQYDLLETLWSTSTRSLTDIGNHYLKVCPTTSISVHRQLPVLLGSLFPGSWGLF